MGRKINPLRRTEVIKTVGEHHEQLTAGGIAKKLGLHPQEVARVLTALEDEPEKVVHEDDGGFLGLFKFW
ncbi:MAG TPA: hypothetical protein P5526_05625 [Anaerolineae bacterium]|nr:hypothetical protein [Anaerolineales bacterium]HRV91621.1 hypothetical protein [Anaerolineae bacterium]